MIPLYDSGDVIGEVPYNQDLDYWDGRNMTNGGTGNHKGFGQAKDGRFYLIYGTQWQGEQSYAKIVSNDRIVKECIKSGNTNLLEEYPELQLLYEEKYDQMDAPKRSKAFMVRINIFDAPEQIDSKLKELKQEIINFQELKSNS